MRSPSAILLLICVCVISVSATVFGRDLDVRVGVYENPPLLASDEGGRPRGLFVDILRHVAAKEGWTLHFLPGNWDENLARLDAGGIDVLPAIAISPGRGQRYLFSEQNVLSNWGQLYLRAGSDIKALPDLDGRRIAVLKGDIYTLGEDGLPAICEKFSLRCEFMLLDSYAEVLGAVDAGKTDAGLVNRIFGITHRDRYKVEPSPILIMPLDVRIAVSRRSPNAVEIQQAIDRGLSTLKRDKQSFYHRFFNSILESDKVVEIIPFWAKWLIAGVGVLVAVLLVGGFALRWQVRARTRALAMSEQKYRGLYETASISIWEEDLSAVYLELSRLRDSGVEDLSAYLDLHPERVAHFAAIVKVTDVNPATLELFAAPSKKALMAGLSVVFSPTSLEVFRTGLLAMWEGKPAFTAEAEHCALDGRRLRVVVSHPVPGSVEAARRVPVIVLDITEREKIQRRLGEREVLLRTLFNALPDLVWLKDSCGAYLSCNQAFERFFGVVENDIIGKTDSHFLGRDLSEAFLRHDQAVIADCKPGVDEEEIPRAGDQEARVLETIRTPVFTESGRLIGVLGVGRDITLRKQQEERILHQAHFDTLTDLPNRFLSLDRLSQLLHDARRDNQQVAVVFLDLDDFKKINDTLGHDVGDSLLIQAARRLSASVRETDTVGRLGGDEFIVLLGGLADADDARAVVETLLRRFRAAFEVDGRDLIVTASIGIALYPGDGDTPSTLLRNADSAMYHAKARGRNTYAFFTREMNRRVSRRLQVEEQMHGALAKGEFRLAYQPQIDMRGNVIFGFEALLRWNNPVLGAVSPEEFVPIAEHTGLIVPLGRFVITEAVAVLARLKQRIRGDLCMAINLSPSQFRDPGLVAYVSSVLRRAGIAGEALELEITEGVLMDGHGYVDKALGEFTGVGIRLVMDDFGTGYSSLSYLRSYPFDVIKIDRSFVHDIIIDEEDRELVSAAISMAHGLNMKVVAEGVETREQLELLARMGCDCAQGNLFSEAVSEDGAARLLEAREKD